MRFNPPGWTWRFFPKKVQRDLAIASIRESMLFFGYDLSAVSNEELENNMATGAHMLAIAMPTIREATEAFHQFAHAAGRAGLAEALSKLNSVYLVNSTTGTKAIILPGPTNKGDHNESEDQQ